MGQPPERPRPTRQESRLIEESIVSAARERGLLNRLNPRRQDILNQLYPAEGDGLTASQLAAAQQVSPELIYNYRRIAIRRLQRFLSEPTSDDDQTEHTHVRLLFNKVRNDIIRYESDNIGVRVCTNATLWKSAVLTYMAENPSHRFSENELRDLMEQSGAPPSRKNTVSVSAILNEQISPYGTDLIRRTRNPDTGLVTYSLHAQLEFVDEYKPESPPALSIATYNLIKQIIIAGKISRIDDLALMRDDEVKSLARRIGDKVLAEIRSYLGQ